MKQKTIYGTINNIDELVNEFEASHKVRATQSYAILLQDIIWHYRVLFYEE